MKALAAVWLLAQKGICPAVRTVLPRGPWEHELTSTSTRNGRLVAGLVCLLVAAAFPSLAGTPALAQGAPYEDVAPDAYYTDPIADLAGSGVFEGTECAEAQFCPDDPVLRSHMAVWIVRVLDGRDPPSVTQPRFADVGLDVWYAAHVERMFELGVTIGCGNGVNYCPDRPVKRSQMAAFLDRAFDLPEGPDPGFSDVSLEVWYADHVAALAAAGLTTGCRDGSVFCPDGITTRGQMAAFLHRAINGDPSPSPRSSKTCQFADQSDSVREAVFQVHTGRGIGSAFYIGNDEWLTAAHVVEGHRDVTLRRGDLELEAVVRGIDVAGDVALLEADGARVRALEFGNSANLKAGGDLYAVGYPLDVARASSVTRGVMSRTEQDRDLGTVIVTDASVNPGNSGGPLVDGCGRIMGMIVAKRVGTEVEGIGYAIAALTLERAIPGLRLGGTGTDPDPEDASSSSSGVGDWRTSEGSGLQGDYVSAQTVTHIGDSAWWPELLYMVIRCTDETDLEVYLGISSAYLIGDAGYIEYRFGDQESPIALYGNISTNNTAVFLRNLDSFIADLRADTSGELHVRVWDYVDYAFIEDSYDFEGGGQLGVRGVEQDVEPVLAACGY